MANIKLTGKLIISGTVVAKTGLHIGGASTGLEIGGVDNIVVRNPVSDHPYIPGSSLKGKMRSLMERRLGLELNRFIRRGKPEVRIHECEREADYQDCEICKVFGVAGEKGFGTPTRLYVRDTPLSRDDAKRLAELDTELPYTEVKWEAAIDRITSAAVPRQFERVPAGVAFKPMGLIFNFYEGDDMALLRRLFEAMELLQDDYLGGMGSRGYGQIAFEGLTLTVKNGDYYADPQGAPAKVIRKEISLEALRHEEVTILEDIRQALGGE